VGGGEGKSDYKDCFRSQKEIIQNLHLHRQTENGHTHTDRKTDRQKSQQKKKLNKRGSTHERKKSGTAL
jgi:hypothetical protein